MRGTGDAVRGTRDARGTTMELSPFRKFGVPSLLTLLFIAVGVGFGLALGPKMLFF